MGKDAERDIKDGVRIGGVDKNVGKWRRRKTEDSCQTRKKRGYKIVAFIEEFEKLQNEVRFEWRGGACKCKIEKKK